MLNTGKTLYGKMVMLNMNKPEAAENFLLKKRM